VSDEAAIRELTERYFYGVDVHDADVLTTCFTVDATMTINGGERTMTGRDAIVEALADLPFASSNHMITGQRTDVDGDRASAHTLAVAFVVDRGSDPLVRTRGIEYRDELVRAADGWRIDRRSHAARWQSDAAAVPPAVPLDRVTGGGGNDQ
jgi:uncharacterized protein (TIGR02246 family)